jgi:hypothetical protein
VVAYASTDVFPRPIASVWEFLRLHVDDHQIHAIHPLVLRQRTARSEGNSVFVVRTIDVRGKPKESTWKITSEPPTLARWEITEGQGPWTQGSWLENRYTEVPGGTQIETRGEITILGLPFFLSQRKWVTKVLDQIATEDLAFLGRA